MITAAAYALAAVIEHDQLLTKIAGLTREIGDVACPSEKPFDDDPESCFRKASEKTFPGSLIDDGPRRLSLEGIAREVADCSECSRLCVLIQRRRVARKQLGIVRRKLRTAARMAEREYIAQELAR